MEYFQCVCLLKLDYCENFIMIFFLLTRMLFLFNLLNAQVAFILLCKVLIDGTCQ